MYIYMYMYMYIGIDIDIDIDNSNMIVYTHLCVYIDRERVELFLLSLSKMYTLYRYIENTQAGTFMHHYPHVQPPR